MKVTLFSAWALWFQGIELKDATLWGITFIWWARLGLILQFIGALTIIVDIVGHKKIREFGKKLKYLYNSEFKNISLVYVYCGDWVVLFYAYMNDQNSGEIKNVELKKKVMDSPLFKIYISTSIVCVAYIIINSSWKEEEWIQLIFVAGFIMLQIMYYLPLVLVTLVLVPLAVLLSIAIALIDIIFIHSIAWLLDRPIAEKKIKFVGILLITIGFHFSLLTI